MSGDDRSTVDDWVHLPPAELAAGVAVAPAPEIALAALRPVLHAVTDVSGQLVDWAIDVAAVLDGGPTHEASATLLREYRSWRGTWRHEYPIGPVSNVASLLDEVAVIDHDLDRHLDALLSRLVAADGETVTIEPDLAVDLGRELETVRLALSVDDRTGVGVIDDMPQRSRIAGLARGWAPPRHEMVLAATPHTSVLLRPDDGLVLQHGPPETAITFAGIAAVDMRADTVLILNDRGTTLRLAQSDARPLGWLVPSSLRWHLRAVPIVTVWTLLFDGLAAALEVADARGVAVHIDCHSMVGNVVGRPPFSAR